MLNHLKNWLVIGAGISSSTLRRRRGVRRALIIPPAGPGSLGDAAMLTSIISYLRTHQYQADLLEIESGRRWDLDANEDLLVPGERFIAYGSRINLAKLLLRLRSYSDLICVGADILDGIYDEARMVHRLELLDRAARAGVRVTIVGSSFSNHPMPNCVNMLRALPATVRIFARDVDSQARMEAALDRPIPLSADVAFLLPTAQHRLDNHPIMEWIGIERAAGRSLIAFNANNLHETRYPNLVPDYARLISATIDLGMSAILVPHDIRTDRSDRMIASEIAAMLSPTQAQHLRIFQASTPGQLKALLARIDLIVTGRMHAAIIAIGSHTPAMSFAYANKFEGLYRHLELDPEELILDLDALSACLEGIVERVDAVRRRAPELRRHIAARLGKLQSAAERNFVGLSE